MDTTVGTPQRDDLSDVVRGRRNDAPPPAAPPPPPFVPPSPQTLEDVGVSSGTVVDLVLKVLYTQGKRSGQQIADALHLPFPLVDDLVHDLQRRQIVEVQGTEGHSRAVYIFGLTDTGRARARDAMETNQYIGPVPVPLDQYRASVAAQPVSKVQLNREKVREGLAGIVLDESMLDLLGPAINSAKSVFLFGDSGNGKTMIADAIAAMLGDSIYIPHAIEVEGRTIVLYDPVYHKPPRAETAAPEAEAEADMFEPEAEDDTIEPIEASAEVEHSEEADSEEVRAAEALAREMFSADNPEKQPVPESPPVPAEPLPDLWRDDTGYDRRYVKVRRPVVITGGELTLDQLDLQYDPFTKMYQAPFQVKANGGVLIVDDFGRQRVPARDLLNRWIVPLEKRIDFLTLHTGGRFPVPFECLVLFATNLEPSELVEEAFLRRIHYKIHVRDPGKAEYREILRRECVASDVAFNDAGLAHLWHECYEKRDIAPRGCHPRDLVGHIVSVARYLERPATLTPELVDRAVETYFLDVSGEAH